MLRPTVNNPINTDKDDNGRVGIEDCVLGGYGEYREIIQGDLVPKVDPGVDETASAGGDGEEEGVTCARTLIGAGGMLTTPKWAKVVEMTGLSSTEYMKFLENIELSSRE